MLWMASVGTDLECGANLDDPDLPDLHDLLDHKPVRRIRLENCCAATLTTGNSLKSWTF